jgi:hypothetical protein
VLDGSSPCRFQTQVVFEVASLKAEVWGKESGPRGTKRRTPG